MRYYYNPPKEYAVTKARIHRCDHPLYSFCTLYEFADNGLAVVQKRFDPKLKAVWYGNIDPWLVDDIFNQEKFFEVFEKYSGNCTDGIYPTINVRKLMWELRMKPLKKLYWETDI